MEMLDHKDLCYWIVWSDLIFIFHCIFFIAFKKDRTGDSSLMVLSTCLLSSLLQKCILNLYYMHGKVSTIYYLLAVTIGLHICSLSPPMSPSFNGSQDMYSSLSLSQIFLANMFSNSSFSSLDVKKTDSHFSNLFLYSFCIPEWLYNAFCLVDKCYKMWSSIVRSDR